MIKVSDCKECGFVRMYNYGKKIYYCGNENRIDDIGKLSVGVLPEATIWWCPIFQ
jgi:hypothetical protein